MAHDSAPVKLPPNVVAIPGETIILFCALTVFIQGLNP